MHASQLFVAALGASSFPYAEATATQTFIDWTESHTRTFDFYSGLPGMVVSENLKAGRSSDTSAQASYRVRIQFDAERIHTTVCEANA